MTPEMWLSVGLMLVGTLAGAVVTWFVARWYYERAGEDLLVRAERLQQAVNVLGRAMEEAGVARISRDEDGDMTGIIFAIRGTAAGRATARGDSDG